MVLQLPGRHPVTVARGEGVWVFDPTGSRYLDAYNSAVHVGHEDPRVAAAAGWTSQDVDAQCAVRILETLNAGMDKVYFCGSGTEANEIALSLARHHTQAFGVIVSAGSYHGHSPQLTSLSSIASGEAVLPAWARAVKVPDLTQCRNRDPRLLSRCFLDEMSAAVRELEDRGFGVAAVLLDPLLAHEGMPVVPEETLTTAIQIVTRAGGLYISDEVQGGLGRTGRFFWSHERYGISPDIVTVGKSLANGRPIGAVITGSNVVGPRNRGLGRGRDSAADPIACAAAQATLDVLEADELRDGATRVGAYLQYRLREVAAEHPLLGEARGEGFHQTLEVLADRHSCMADPSLARRIANEMTRRGVLVSCATPQANLIRIRPPMPFELQHVDLLVNSLQETLRFVAPW